MSDSRAVRTGSVLVLSLLALALLLATWFGAWDRVEAAPPELEDLANEVRASEPTRGDVERVIVRDDVDRAERRLPPPVVDLAHPFEHRLNVMLRDPFGFPVEDAQVFVAPPKCGFSLWPKASDAGGLVRLHWRARQRVMAVQVAVVAWGVVQPMREVQLDANEPKLVTLLVLGRKQTGARNAELSQFELAKVARKVRRARQASDRDLLDELDFVCGRSMWEFRSHECTVCHETSRLGAYGTLSRAASIADGLHPFATFQSLQFQARRKTLAEKKDDQKRSGSRKRRRRSRGARIVGRVLGVDGKPAVDVPVALARQGEIEQLTRTNSRGQYVIEPVSPGTASLIAGGGRLGEARRSIAVGRQRELTWDPILTSGRTVRGIVVDGAGQPRTNWRVELHRTAGDYVGVGVVDRDGRFQVHGVPGPVECLVWPQANSSPFPLLHGRAALVDAPPVRLAFDLQSPVRARLRAHAAVPGGYQSARIDARLTQVETGRVAFAKPMGFEQAFQVEPLNVGFYRLQMGAAGLGWVQSREVWVDGRGLWDIGRLHLAEPVAVEFSFVGAGNPFAGSHELYRRTEAMDVRMDYQRRGAAVVLPRGDYVLIWTHQGERRAHEFTVEGGAKALVEIVTGM